MVGNDQEMEQTQKDSNSKKSEMGKNKNNNQVLILRKHHIVSRFQNGGHSVTQS